MGAWAQPDGRNGGVRGRVEGIGGRREPDHDEGLPVGWRWWHAGYGWRHGRRRSSGMCRRPHGRGGLLISLRCCRKVASTEASVCNILKHVKPAVHLFSIVQFASKRESGEQRASFSTRIQKNAEGFF